MPVNREALKQALADAQGIQKLSVNSDNFGGGRAGVAGLAAQLATAGIGAYARKQNQDKLDQQDAVATQAFAAQYPQYANLAKLLSPESKEALSVEAMKNSIDSENPMNKAKLLKEQLGFGTELLNQDKIIGENSTNLLNQKKIIAETNKLNKEASGKLIDPENKFKNTTALRQDYLTNSKTFQGVREGYERVISSAKDPSPSGDLSLIYSYMKTLDPNSTVREGEFATAQSAGSLPDTLVARYNKVINGERLAPEMRSDFVARSQKLYDQANKSQQKITDQYSKIAQRNGLDPNDVTIDFSTTATPLPANRLDSFKSTPLDAIQAEIARRRAAK